MLPPAAVSGEELPEATEKLDPPGIPLLAKCAMVRLKRGGLPEPRRFPSRLRIFRRGRASRPHTEVRVFHDKDSSVRAPKMLGQRVSPMSRMRKSPISRSTTLQCSRNISEKHQAEHAGQRITLQQASMNTRVKLAAVHVRWWAVIGRMRLEHVTSGTRTMTRLCQVHALQGTPLSGAPQTYYVQQLVELQKQAHHPVHIVASA